MSGTVVSSKVGIFNIVKPGSMVTPASFTAECLSLTHQVTTTVAAVIVIVAVERATATRRVIAVAVIGLEITSRGAIAVHLDFFDLDLDLDWFGLVDVMMLFETSSVLECGSAFDSAFASGCVLVRVM